MYAKLTCKSIGEELRVEKGGELVVGREPGDIDHTYIIDNPYMSRVHAVFTYKNELCIQDMNSRNGSYVNGRRLKRDEMIPLSEGDFVRLGNIEFRLHYEGKPGKSNEHNGLRYEMRNSVGGRKLQVEVSKKGCIKYQIRMIEENPSLCIADVTHVSNIRGDCFMCDLGDYMSVADIIEQKPGRVNGIDIFEKILKAVKNGEDCMLNRSRYIISPETVFIDMNGSIKLIYVPCVDKLEDRFNEGMASLCESFLKKCREKDRKKLQDLKNICGSGITETAGLMKQAYKMKDYSVEIRSHDSSEDKLKDEKSGLKLEHVITFVSFAVLIALVWLGHLSTTNIAAVFLIVAGINVVLYGSKSKKEEGPKKEKFSKTPGGVQIKKIIGNLSGKKEDFNRNKLS